MELSSKKAFNNLMKLALFGAIAMAVTAVWRILNLIMAIQYIADDIAAIATMVTWIIFYIAMFVVMMVCLPKVRQGSGKQAFIFTLVMLFALAVLFMNKLFTFGGIMILFDLLLFAGALVTAIFGIINKPGEVGKLLYIGLTAFVGAVAVYGLYSSIDGIVMAFRIDLSNFNPSIVLAFIVNLASTAMYVLITVFGILALVSLLTEERIAVFQPVTYSAAKAQPAEEANEAPTVEAQSEEAPAVEDEDNSDKAE